MLFLSSALKESPEPVFQNVCLSPISRPLIGRKYLRGGYWGGWARQGPQICCSIKRRKGCAELCHTQTFSLANLWKSHFFWFDGVMPHSDSPPPPNFFLPPIKKFAFLLLHTALDIFRFTVFLNSASLIPDAHRYGKWIFHPHGSICYELWVRY